ncbi:MULTISPECIES: hypothetical protein [Burkholderia]|uniref:hypothetical protein n=1 Tax=Burkholderia TaxID=32008 RepID=UPI0015E1510A|nr:hypothetical protein [Burkholderia sp. MSMB175]
MHDGKKTQYAGPRTRNGRRRQCRPARPAARAGGARAAERRKGDLALRDAWLSRQHARQIGVTRPLLYRYFPGNETPIDRVYDEIDMRIPDWKKLIADRTLSLQERLVAFSCAHPHSVTAS